ncbi:MAG TPA: leucyl/phenylalanyl-tRNA--protein transferase [Steroidobacteraceae bacterium]|nr:leucyl/phenylalanyl-tRNA--protein transferase [Steroidobacteraceae bacterium]
MKPITWLAPADPPARFPPVAQALHEPQGLLAASGDLAPARLQEAYRRGIFPWYSPGEPILWWSPDPREVLFPGEMHVSRSLRRTLRRALFQVTENRAFATVVASCATARGTAGGTWITPEMQAAYCQLHGLGVAHSIEVWSGGELAGGLYGVLSGRVFSGESMFSRRSDASKVALAWLATQAPGRGIALIDCQMPSAHLRSLGSRPLPRRKFLEYLAA